MKKLIRFVVLALVMTVPVVGQAPVLVEFDSGKWFKVANGQFFYAAQDLSDLLPPAGKRWVTVSTIYSQSKAALFVSIYVNNNEYAYLTVNREAAKALADALAHAGYGVGCAGDH